VAGIALGASIGREGPTVQVGAAIMLATGRLSPRRLKGLVLAGGAAGVAAAFNTPLAGIVFAIEELSRDYERRASVGVIAAVITAGLTSLALVGNYTYFGSTAATVGGWSEWAAVPVCGIVFGIAGGVFSRLLIACSVPSEGQFARFRRARPIAFASACGLGVAMLGLLTSGATFGTGYAEARSLLHGGGAYALFGPAKLAATLLSAISGIPGGIFAPSLTVGAGLGAELARVMGGQGGEALVLMGMVAYFAGVVQAPITAFVIVMEMTENHAMLLPLMAAAVLAQGVSRIVCPRSLYHALAEGYVAMASRNGRIVAEATAPKAPL
jgi:H+/Cl- antiporter ClcA